VGIAESTREDIAQSDNERMGEEEKIGGNEIQRDPSSGAAM